jgi:hypothetical protein
MFNIRELAVAAAIILAFTAWFVDPQVLCAVADAFR